MKSILLFSVAILLVNSFSSCKKSIDQRKEDYVLSVMTNGRWFLESYVENGVDNTVDFLGYEFQFYEAEKLEAISNAGTETGLWVGDINNLTLTVNFASTGELLKRLNHVWQFVDSHVGLVFAETTTPAGKISIRLRRK